MGKNYRIWKIHTQLKNTMYKKLVKLEPQTVDLGKKERPDGSKTLKGDPGKIRDIHINFLSRWIENPKGQSRQKLGILFRNKEQKDCNLRTTIKD